MNWNEACKAVGYENDYSKRPLPVYGYFAYKEGEVLKCDTLKEAKDFSENYEKVILNKKEIKEYDDEQNELENKASELFHQELRKKYSDLSDEDYNTIYKYAYDKAHAYGYDEVASVFSGVYDVVAEILYENV